MKPKTSQRVAIILASLCSIIALLAACAPQVTKVEGSEADQVTKWSEPMADNLFAALNSGDYAAFSRDFDPVMVKAVPESGFKDLLNKLTNVGKFQSRTVDHVEKVKTYYVVVYNAKFEQDMVTVRLTFNQAEPHLISGLWFNSPKIQ